MALMKFRLKQDVGVHKQDGKTYQPGSIVTSRENLIKKCVGKFEEVHETRPEPEPEVPAAPAAEPEAPAGEAEPQEEGEVTAGGEEAPAADPRGDDVTGDFSDAVKAECKVFLKAGEYSVYDADTDKLLNKAKLMTKPATAQYIKKRMKEM